MEFTNVMENANVSSAMNRYVMGSADLATSVAKWIVMAGRVKSVRGVRNCNVVANVCAKSACR